MLRLHRIVPEVHQDVVDFLVVLKLIDVHFVNLVAAHFVWEVAHFVLLCVNSVLDRLVDVDLEGSLVNLFHGLPNLPYTLPNLQQDLLVLLKTVEYVCVAELHVEQFLRFADSD